MAVHNPAHERVPPWTGSYATPSLRGEGVLRGVEEPACVWCRGASARAVPVLRRLTRGNICIVLVGRAAHPPGREAARGIVRRSAGV